MSAGEISSSYGLVQLAQVWNNGSFPQCMHSEVGSQIITSTWLDIMNEQGRGCDIGGRWREGKKRQGSERYIKMDVKLYAAFIWRRAGGGCQTGHHFSGRGAGR